MSLVTLSTKRDRVYRRAFDHDECRRLRETDPKTWTYRALAAHFGVSTTAVMRILNPKVAKRMSERANDWNHARPKELCRGGCGTLVWTHHKSRTGYCRTCLAELRTESVRDDSLRCSRCRQWKPDDAFYKQAAAKTRRQRSNHCRTCSTVVRREYRQHNLPQERATERKNRLKRGTRVSKFIVFQPNGVGINEIARVDAVSWSHAIEQVADREGEYIAVLESRFMRATVKPVQAFKVEGAT